MGATKNVTKYLHDGNHDLTCKSVKKTCENASVYRRYQKRNQILNIWLRFW